jgi:dUTP pyrophosphatase
MSERELVGLPIKLLHPDAQLPTYAHDDDSCMDVYASVNPNKERELMIGAFLPEVNVNKVSVLWHLEPIPVGGWLLQPMTPAKVSLGFSIATPPGWEVQLRCRSGLAAKNIMVANGLGTIDSGFTGEMCALLTNLNDRNIIIRPGDKIAQICIKRAPKIVLELVDELPKTERGQGGFGSTGTR